MDESLVEPRVLGGDLTTTWRDWATGFSPGRLDYVLSGTGVRTVQSFVLDTAGLSVDAAAARLIDSVRPVLQNEARSFGLRSVSV